MARSDQFSPLPSKSGELAMVIVPGWIAIEEGRAGGLVDRSRRRLSRAVGPRDCSTQAATLTNFAWSLSP